MKKEYEKPDFEYIVLFTEPITDDFGGETSMGDGEQDPGWGDD